MGVVRSAGGLSRKDPKIHYREKRLGLLENTSDGYNHSKEALSSNVVPAC